MKRILEKYKATPDTVKASIAFVICSFITKGIVFFTTPIFTRIMNIDQYGMVATYNSWISIIEIFAVLGLTSAGVFNVGLNDNKENRNRYISICLGICNISTLLVFLLIFILKLFLGDTFIVSGNLLIVMFIHFLFSPAQIFWITRNRYEYKYKMATTVTVLTVLAGQALAIAGVLYNPENSAFLKILGNEVGTLLFAIPIYIIILKRGKDYVNLKEWKKILFLAIPLIPHYLAQHVMSSADRIMISKMVGNADAAIYSVVANIGMIGTIFWTAINGSLVPYTFNKLNENKYEDIKNVSKKLTLGYLIVCIGVIMIAPEVLKILAPVEYYPGIYIVPVITVVIFMQALYNLYANIEFYHKKTKQIAMATLSATIINIILNYIFIPKYSYIAAAYTTLISYSVLVFAHYINYKKCTEEKIYDNRFILILTIILFIVSIFSTVLYVFNDIIRYVFIVAIIIVFLIKRKKIIEIIKALK